MKNSKFLKKCGFKRTQSICKCGSYKAGSRRWRRGGREDPANVKTFHFHVFIATHFVSEMLKHFVAT